MNFLGSHLSLGFHRSSTLNMKVLCLHLAQKVSNWCYFLSSIFSICTTLFWTLLVLQLPWLRLKALARYSTFQLPTSCVTCRALSSHSTWWKDERMTIWRNHQATPISYGPWRRSIKVGDGNNLYWPLLWQESTRDGKDDHDKKRARVMTIARKSSHGRRRQARPLQPQWICNHVWFPAMAAAVTTDTIDSQHLFYKETQYFFILKLLYNEIDNVKIVTNKTRRVGHVKF